MVKEQPEPDPMVEFIDDFVEFKRLLLKEERNMKDADIVTLYDLYDREMTAKEPYLPEETQE